MSGSADLPRNAKTRDINLSATLEAALAIEVNQGRAEQWLKDNKPSLDAYNRFFEKHGVFSDRLRGF